MKIRILALIVVSLGMIYSLQAQRHMTRTGHIGFISETPMETIEADNNQVTSIIDIAKGNIVFKL